MLLNKILTIVFTVLATLNVIANFYTEQVVIHTTLGGIFGIIIGWNYKEWRNHVAN